MEFPPGVVEHEYALPEKHQHSFSHGLLTGGSSSQFESGNKSCRFCKRRIPTQQFTSEPTLCDETESRTHNQMHDLRNADTNRLVPALVRESQRKESERMVNIDYRWKDVGLLVAALNKLSAALVKQEGGHDELGEPDDLRKEASDAIRRAESCLLGLQTGSNQNIVRDTITENIIQEELSYVLNSFEPDTVSANPLVIRGSFKKATPWNSVLSCPVDRVASGSYTPNPTRSPSKQRRRENEMLFDVTTRQRYQMPSHNFDSKGLFPHKKERLRGLPYRETWLPDQAVPRDKLERSGAPHKLSRQSSRADQANDSDCKLNYRTSKAHTRPGFPLRMSKRRSVINKQPDDLSLSLTTNSDDDETRKYPRRKILHHNNTNSSSSNQESEEMNSCSTSSTERFYTPIHKQRKKYVKSSNTSSESLRYTPPRPSHRYKYSTEEGETSSTSQTNHGDHEVTSTSPMYESEEYSLPSSPRSDEEFSSSGDTEEYSSDSDREGPTTRNPKAAKVNKAREGGAWKKLKDKLAIIFHHHHHHYHHHHHHRHHPTTTSEDDDDPSNQRIKCDDQKKEVGNQSGVKKVDKSLVNPARTRKHENTNIGSLVGGLFSHIKHKKKSKTVSNVKLLGRSKQGGGWKKKHWWQTLHPQKHVKKLGLGHNKK